MFRGRDLPAKQAEELAADTDRRDGFLVTQLLERLQSAAVSQFGELLGMAITMRQPADIMNQKYVDAG